MVGKAKKWVKSRYFGTKSSLLLATITTAFTAHIFGLIAMLPFLFVLIRIIFIEKSPLNKILKLVGACFVIFIGIFFTFNSLGNKTNTLLESEEICGLIVKSDERSVGLINIKSENKLYLEKLRILLNKTEAEEFQIKELEYICLKGDFNIFQNQFGYSTSIANGSIKDRFEAASDIKSVLENAFIKPVDENLGNNSRILKAIVLGVKDGLTNEDEDQFKTLGITHLLVASGANIVLIVELIDKIFALIVKRFSLNKRSMRLNALRIIVVSSYLLIVGLEGSITRAFFFFLMTVFGVFTTRQLLIWNKILLSTVIMLLLFPGLVFSYSYALSIIAVLALNFAGTFCDYFQLESEGAKSLVSSFIVPLVMFIPTSYFFREINLLSLFGNLVIAPAVELFVLIGFFYIIYLFVLGRIELFYFLTNNVTNFINFVIEGLGFFNQVIIDFFSKFSTLIYYKMSSIEIGFLLFLILSIQIYFSYKIYIRNTSFPREDSL